MPARAGPPAPARHPHDEPSPLVGVRRLRWRRPRTGARWRTGMQCRSCGTTLEHTFCDLGMSPMANSYVAADALGDAETFYPLHAYVCAQCLLVQLLEFESPDAIFSDYAYFSSFSSSWVEHAKRYVEAMIPR